MTNPVESTTDVPAPLMFTDTAPDADHWRVALWAEPGSGKSCAAASAPDPILVVTADRPRAWRFPRSLYPKKDIREVRYEGTETLNAVYRYLKSDQGKDIKTVVLDPFQTIYDRIVDTSALRGDGDPDWQGVNKKMLGFLHSLREFPVHVVIIAHERLNDGRKGDGKLYPHLGGPALINKVMQEMDAVAHVERVDSEGDEDPRWFGQLASTPHMVCKEGTGVLGDRRELDLSEWFHFATVALAPIPDPDDPFTPEAEPEEPPAEYVDDVDRQQKLADAA